MLRPIAALALPLFLVAAHHPEKDPLAGRVPGTPVECVDDHFATGPGIIDQNTILYSTPGTIYRAGSVGDCPALEPSATLIIEEKIGGEVCHNDLFRVRRLGETIPSQYCRFTKFTPYRKPKAPR